MDLSSILQKTKAKSQKITTQRKPPSIAIEERPYSFDEPPIIDQNNQRQIRDKLETKQSELVSLVETNKRQIEDNTKACQRIETEYGDEIRDTSGDTNRDKLETKKAQNNVADLARVDDVSTLLTPFSSLVGIQRKIVLFLYEECKLNRSKRTQPLTMEYIKNSCGSTISSIKKSIQRLENKEIVKRTVYKLGRSGWTQYELTDQVYNEILYSENYRPAVLNQHYFRDKLETQVETELETTLSSSSSSNINTTTTTTLPLEWRQLDVSPLSGIHFGHVEIRNIFNKCPESITPDIVQDSIHQFSYGLIHNPERYKNMKSPAAILVKNLCQGIPWRENGYVSVEEQMKQEKENRVTMLIEKQFKEPKFLAWFNGLNQQDKENFVPQVIKHSTAYVISKNVIEKEYAKKYFDSSLWPEILSELKMMDNAK